MNLTALPGSANAFPRRACRTLAIGIGILGFLGAAQHPLGPAYGFVAYFLLTVVLSAVSGSWLFAIPLVYAVGDLYPWTGRLLVTEADLVCAAAASVALWQMGDAALKEALDRRFLWLWMPLVVCCTIAFVIGWRQLPTPIAEDELSLYGTRLNALRIAKGYAWGVFFAPLIIAACRTGARSVDTVVAGIRTGALIVGGLVVWERLVTVGLLNADDPYRATGPMFSSHIGGMQIDAYWAATLPILMIPPQTGRRLAWIGYICLLVLAYLAVASTMSRGVILVAAFQSVTVVAAVMINLMRRRTNSARQLVGGLAAGLGIFVGTLVMLTSSEAMWSRLAGISADWNVRWSHWTQLCHAATTSGKRASLGNGMGTLPNLLATIEQLPARPIALAHSASGDVVLRMEPGRSVFVEQLVDASAPGPWRLTVDAEVSANARLGYHLCRKTLYRSFECIEGTLARSSEQLHPSAKVVNLDVARLKSRQPDVLRPPLTIALSAGGRDSHVDVASVRLEDANGRSLIRNEDFHRGSSFWFFTSDDLSAWRADNLWVHLYVEQGILGVIAFGWLVCGTLWFAAPAVAKSGDAKLVGFGLGIVGFLAIGSIGSLLDTANLTCLFLLYIGVAQAIAFGSNDRACGRRMATSPKPPVGDSQQDGNSGTYVTPLAAPAGV